jgi:malonyl-CoA/methylmalonyl-CoA synthetase
VNVVAELLLAPGRMRPEAVVITDQDGVHHSNAELDARSAQYANALIVLGVQPGDRVAVQIGKSFDLVALHIGTIRAGGVYLPLNASYTDREVGDLMEDAEPALLVRDEPLEHAVLRLSTDELAELVDGAATHFHDVSRTVDDPASILYTSGTTGKPKGAVLSHGNLAASTQTLIQAWQFTDNDVLLHILPLFHIHGLYVALYCSLASGSSTVFIDKFDAPRIAEMLPLSTVLMGVPTHYTRLLEEPSFNAAAVRKIRLFTSGSAPMLVATHDAFRERTGHTILERYGMTETGMLASNPYEGDRKPGFVGLPLPGVEIRIDGSTDGAGEIQVRGDNVFAGYWKRPELRATEFTEDGWFRTGDLGRFDEEGYVEIVGRSKDLIITGGLNVYPKELELIIDEFPGVAESAVIGLPDADFGEAVIAIVVAEPGVVLEAAELRFKVPKRFHIVDSLPRNTMGKVEKAKLRKQFADN